MEDRTSVCVTDSYSTNTSKGGPDKIKILIVDDEDTSWKNLKCIFHRFLQKKENIFTSDNAAKALEIISSQQPDIILTDIRMPGKDGLYIFLSCIIIFQIRS